MTSIFTHYIMRTKKLEEFFKAYATTHTPPTEDDVEMSPIYSSEQFHVNTKQGTVYIQDIGVAEVSDLATSPANPDWLAIVRIENTSQVRIVMGHGNPYREDLESLLPRHNDFMTVVPQSLLAPYQKLREQVKGI